MCKKWIYHFTLLRVSVARKKQNTDCLSSLSYFHSHHRTNLSHEKTGKTKIQRKRASQAWQWRRTANRYKLTKYRWPVTSDKRHVMKFTSATLSENLRYLSLGDTNWKGLCCCFFLRLAGTLRLCCDTQIQAKKAKNLPWLSWLLAEELGRLPLTSRS